MLFWSLVIVLTLVVIAAVVRPLLTGTFPDNREQEDGLRVSIYRENLQELEEEYQRGQLSTDQLDDVRHEMELSLLAETKEKASFREDAGNRSRGRNLPVAGIVAAFILLSASLLYYLQGNPQLNELREISRVMSGSTEGGMPAVREMTAALEKHLARNPADLNGWMLLANAYVSLSEYKSAIPAFEQLYKHMKEDPDFLLGYANALVMANNGRFAGRPAELIRQVLALDPENYTALFFSGLAAEQAGEFQRANEYYASLLPVLQDNPELRQTVNRLIARNRRISGQVAEVAGGEQGPVPATETRADPAASVSVRVSVAKDLDGEYRPEDTLFIYARAVEGPPMPLAVIRARARDLPLETVLDDTRAMSPALKLSEFERVKLQARISRSGNARPQPGDLYGEITGVKVAGAGIVNLTIDKVMP